MTDRSGPALGPARGDRFVLALVALVGAIGWLGIAWIGLQLLVARSAAGGRRPAPAARRGRPGGRRPAALRGRPARRDAAGVQPVLLVPADRGAGPGAARGRPARGRAGRLGDRRVRGVPGRRPRLRRRRSPPRSAGCRRPSVRLSRSRSPCSSGTPTPGSRSSSASASWPSLRPDRRTAGAGGHRAGPRGRRQAPSRVGRAVVAGPLAPGRPAGDRGHGRRRRPRRRPSSSWR